jgi:hypothetical protein
VRKFLLSATVLLGMTGGALAATPLPTYDISSECQRPGFNNQGLAWSERVAKCQQFETELKGSLRYGYGHNDSWDEQSSDLRDYCVNYDMPRMIEFENNAGQARGPNYSKLWSCISTKGGTAPWLDNEWKGYMGPYKNDTDHYYPGWHAK